MTIRRMTINYIVVCFQSVLENGRALRIFNMWVHCMLGPVARSAMGVLSLWDQQQDV